ncbi:hypothetical protein EGW08_016365 [Elysia chlorotica]|uniref:Uncharacterized protein n=1 Tax=Elysia chlorotica TaxID=188477 RepID=A0A433T2W2_ELYCH|nr:hypothetical protein EGW08_016365 [Elysia chlorotica]
MVPFGYAGTPAVRSEPEDGELYPLDLSVRSTNKADGEGAEPYPQPRPMASRQRPAARPGGAESRFKHHDPSRTQQRLSPYTVPVAVSGGHAHSPSSSRSPVPQRTDSPLYGRRRTPSPAYYPAVLAEGGFRTGHLHQVHQPHYLPGPPQLVAPHSDHSCSPLPFQALTSSDSVLHGAGPGLFKPYQDTPDADMATEDSTGQHQNRDPRRQLLRQLQLSQQQQQQQQQQDEEEERTYVDLDCPSQAAHTAHPRHTEGRPPHFGHTNGGTETPMEVVAHASDSRGPNRLPSVGYSEEDARREMERHEGPRPTAPCYLQSELLQKGNDNSEESHHYLRQAFLSSDAQQRRHPGDADRIQSHVLSHHHLKQQQQHAQKEMLLQQEAEEEARHRHRNQLQSQEPKFEPAPSHHKVPMAVSSIANTMDSTNVEKVTGKANTAEKVHQEALEEAKLLTFLSKTTLVTLKPNEQLGKDAGQCDSPGPQVQWDQRQNGSANLSAHNIFKDFHAGGGDTDSCGKLPQIDYCLSSAVRGGTPSSCKTSLMAPKKICFRLVDLVGLLVEQSLRA